MMVPLTPVRCLYRAVDLYGNKEGVICGNHRFTYRQFGERCERLAAGLLSEGIRPRDRVAFLSFNNHELLEGYYGPLLIGAISMPLNVRLTPQELAAILNHSGARILIFENDFAAMIGVFRRACPAIERYIAIDGTRDADLAYDELISRGPIDRPDLFSMNENEIAEIFYTSGSTGTPKGVALSHRTLYLHAVSLLASTPNSDRLIELHTIPLFHANGWGRAQTCVMNGQKQVMVRRFDPVFVLRMIQDEKATGMSLVPAMANALLNCPELGRFNVSSLEEIHLGGAASSPELVTRMKKALQCGVVVGYGLTETSPVVSSSRLKGTVEYAGEEDRIEREAMTGWPIIGNEVRVVNAWGEDVPRDRKTVGEIIVRGDNVMDCYYNDPEGTRAAITDGWLHTGDMAVWDEERYMLIVDRKKDIIISGGENISSIEIEKAIFAHDAVFECAVVAAPDTKWGEIPAAIIVTKPGQTLTEAELVEFLEARIAKFKIPRRFEFWEEQLPKTGTGKILKRELRERFWSGKEKRVQG